MRGRDPRALGSDQHLPGRLQTPADCSPRQPILAVAALASWSDVTRGELAERVRLVAAGLIARGSGAGDPVAVMSGTRLEWTILTAGAVTVPGYWPSLAHEIEFISWPRKGSVNAHGRR